MLEIDVFTLFPEAFAWLAETRPLRNATDAGQLRLRVLDLRDHALGGYRQFDDAPYGGGAGMLIRVDVVCAALESTYGAAIDQVLRDRRVAVLAPVGRDFTDAVADELSVSERLTLLCGREIPAMAVVDAVCRKLPGALGKEQSHLVESFSPQLDGGLEYPHYTRPEEFRGWTVPEVLLSGHHGEIEAWRRRRSQERSG